MVREVRILPHNSKEFPTAKDLADWIVTELKDRGGVYRVTTKKKYSKMAPGSVCLFMRDKQIVGEGIVKEPVQEYVGEKISPVTRKPYEGIIIFEPSSLRRYVRPLELGSVDEFTQAKLTPRFGGKLTWDEYERLLSIVVKNGFY